MKGNSVVEQSVFSDDEICLKAKKPTVICVSRGQESWFAENEELDVYATGITKEEALLEFQSQVIYFYSHYKSLPENKMLQHARNLKRTFMESFSEEIDA